MANPKTEKIKRQIYNLLEKERLSIYELCKRGFSGDFLTGALQSMWAKGDIILETPAGAENLPGDVTVARSHGAAGEQVPDAQFVAMQVTQARARLRQEVQREVERILSDGVPRGEEEMEERTDLYGIKPESIQGVITLSDGSFTLRTTDLGKSELQRREREAREKAARIQRQKKLLADIFKDGEAVSEEELEKALTEPLAPEVAGKLVLLTDGMYALPDSAAAMEDVAAYVARREPVGRKAFAKMFRDHKKLVAALSRGEERAPFVILPDGRVTVDDHPAGQKELQRREIQARMRQKLDDLMHGSAFFSLSDFSGQEKKAAVEEAMNAGCAWVECEGYSFWCSPLKFSPRQMAEELEKITGADFPVAGKTLTPVVYLLENSCKPGEVSRRLAVKPNQVINLYRSGYLPGFNLEGSLRIWSFALETAAKGPGLERAIKRTEEIGLPETARVLGIPRDMVSALVREGRLTPVERPGGRRAAKAFRRGDVEDLLAVVPRFKEKWEAARARKVKGAGGRRRPVREQEETPLAPRGPITLDRFQREAIEALEGGQSVLVAAPTGTGKTVIAEKVVEKVLAEEREVIYTSPIKALSNQKFRDFAKLYGRERVGLITGDVSINERSPLLVMTTEIFRNWCFSNPEWMTNISFVIFDEIHYLDDPHRGTAWEESIIFAPPHVKILGLSATVPNIDRLAAWMSEVRRYPVKVVEEKERAVPLVIRWVTPEGEVLTEDEAREEVELQAEGDGIPAKKSNIAFRRGEFI